MRVAGQAGQAAVHPAFVIGELPVLAALCDIFEVTADQLIATTARNTPARKAAGAGGGEVTKLNAIRPRRAQLRPER